MDSPIFHAVLAHFHPAKLVVYRRAVATLVAGMMHATTRHPHCSGPRPRVYIYPPGEGLMPKGNRWRLGNQLTEWIATSVYFEPDGDCADYFLMPGHVDNVASREDMRPLGDIRNSRLFDYVRHRWPWWNRTVLAGTARHMVLLPCDHGPGDCGWDRPIMPHKYWPPKNPATRPPRNEAVAEIRRVWGADWELLNPASPRRLVFFLQYSGWADQLHNERGNCINCFQAGVDVRLPTPEDHSCGPLCGIPRKLPGVGFLSPAARRYSMASRTVQSPPHSTRPRPNALARGPRRNCTLFWAGTAGIGSNSARKGLMRLNGSAGMCIVATNRQDESTRRVDMATAMRDAHYCYSPRGWDNGDSDRYTPAILYGCVPLMADQLEGMPLEELPELSWPSMALAVHEKQMLSLPRLLNALPAGYERKLQATAAGAWQRLLYSSLTFSCCADARCPTKAQLAKRLASAHLWSPKMRTTPCSSLKQPTPSDSGGAPAVDARARAHRRPATYLGEDGSRDALEGLMALLKHRLHTPHAPPEPWSVPADCLDRNGTGRHGDPIATEPLSAGHDHAPLPRCELQRDVGEPPAPLVKWFKRRKDYYASLLSEARPLELLQPVPPAAGHRTPIAWSV